jgi:arabinose-5-phosphate isomerase
MGDALAVCLLKYKGFSKNDFALTHPLGSLGKKLLSKITDIMSIIEDTPYINPDANIKEAIYAISSKGLGFVVVVNENLVPIGIFTDGDLRRALNQEIDIMNEKIKDLMVKKFTTIENIKLSVEAVKLMSDNKILMLPVIDSDGRLCGAINMRQLIQAGVI